jgi:molybdopterin converting factor small subunit
MSVTINLPSYLQPHANNSESVAVRGKTVGECLDNLMKQFPDMKKMLLAKEGHLLPYVSIFIDNEIAYDDMLDKPVKDGDRLYILYIVGGG